MAYSKQSYLKENEEKIINWLNDYVPLAEISRNLSIKYDTLKRYLDRNRIEYKTNPHREGKPHKEARKPAAYYLGTDLYITSKALKKKLIEDGIKEYVCECCGNSEWMGEPIPLELHHINGNHYDNSLENLEILCSNCHSLKHLYCKNIFRNPKLFDINNVCKE